MSMTHLTTHELKLKVVGMGYQPETKDMHGFSSGASEVTVPHFEDGITVWCLSENEEGRMIDITRMLSPRTLADLEQELLESLKG